MAILYSESAIQGEDGMSSNAKKKTSLPDLLLSLASSALRRWRPPPPPCMPSPRRRSPRCAPSAEEFLVVPGLVVVQVVNAAYMVLLAPILNLGIRALSLIMFGNLATSVFVMPFAVAFERKKWPARLGPWLVAQFMFIAFGGVTVFQMLLLSGLKKTSPAIASAMPNLAPGVIFIMASCLGFEKVNIRCRYSITKIIGTMVCLGGVLAMSFLQSPSASSTETSLQSFDREWLIGCFCLLGAVLVVSYTTVLQAAVMLHFPAPFTLCAIISSMGALITAVVQIITEGNLGIGSPANHIWLLVSVILLGGMLTASSVAFTTWCVQKKGPVLVSMFSPLQTVSSAILSAFLLGKVISLGSIVGMFLMFVGLYMVLWAKKKEDAEAPDVDATTRQPTVDIEKPLLS